MTEPVKHRAMLLRYEPRLQAILPQGAILCGEEPVEVYLATDYERLEQECARFCSLWELELSRATTVESECQKKQWQIDTALQLLAQCQEHLHPHRDAVLWGKVVEALRDKPC